MIIFKSEHNEGYRAPTIREISSLMGFPINYQFKGNHNNKHKQIGNAVCVQLSQALANAILKKDNIRNYLNELTLSPSYSDAVFLNLSKN